MDDITDADCTYAKRVCKNFKIKQSGDCNDLYFESNTLLAADVFENFRNMCLEIYEFYPAHLFSALGLI